MMVSRVFMFLTGAVYAYYLVYAAEDVHVAELMVESEVTLDAETILSALNTKTNLIVTDANGVSHTVTFLSKEVIAECRIVGLESECNCSDGYIWSNYVCDTEDCCSETTCKKNVSYITPLCIAKVHVKINGSVTLSGSSWDSSKTQTLTSAFQELNGFKNLNITGHRDGYITDFEVIVFVKCDTDKLKNTVSTLEASLGPVLIDTVGMVTIETPSLPVCYMSSPLLKCTLEEKTDSAGWNLTTNNERFGLNNGSVVKVNNTCATDEYESCTEVTVQGITGLWIGTYECGFTSGSIRHIARTYLNVALLPDKIILDINPLTVDCSTGIKSVQVDVNATILKSTEIFEVAWFYGDEGPYTNIANKSFEDWLVYSFVASINCKDPDKKNNVNVTFKNTMSQVKHEKVDIPVIYKGDAFCSEDIQEDLWPKTPSGSTVIKRTCEQFKIGYKSRTCEGTTWQQVYDNCVSEELNKVLNKADYFLMGLGATDEGSTGIFEGLKNTTTSDSDDSMADIRASINVLTVMFNASETFALQENIFPDFVNSASSMLNKTWERDNASVIQNMSANYLGAVEGLVKNIKVNQINEFTTENLELKFCSSGQCNVSVFDIEVNMNTTSGIMKTVAVKNLMNKLANNFPTTETTNYLVSATLENSNDSDLEIRLSFPTRQLTAMTPLCVFWNTTTKEWSNEGCIVKTNDENHTLCECNHLTSFSILMSRGDVSNSDLDNITKVGMCMSICALVIFLIIEFLVWSALVKTNLSHLRHTAMVNIAVFLLLADCCFLASSNPKTLSDTWCLVLTLCKHLFFLAMFCWMLVLSAMLVHQLIFVFSPLRKRVFMFLSSILGYVCPILIVGSSYVYCKYTNKPYYTKKCWLVYERLLEGSMHAFLLPVGTVIMINLFSMAVVILTLTKTTVPDGSKTDDKDTAKSILKVVVFLTPVFGVTWVIGFFLLILENQDSVVFAIANYSFTILNSFQGVFILIPGCFAERKVREELMNVIMGKSNGKSESTKHLNSTTLSKEK